MKKLTFYLTIILFIGSNSLAIAQYGKQKKADHYFNTFSFVKAAELYEELLKNDYNTSHAQRRLAECYTLLRDPKNAVKYYKEIITESDIPESYYYNYAQALRGIEDYEGAKKWMKKFKKASDLDRQTKKILRKNGKSSQIFQIKKQYRLSNVDFNSKYSDFGAYVHDEKLYYISAKNNGEKSQLIYTWNEQPFLDIYRQDATTKESEKIVGDVNSKYHDGPLAITKDGNTMFFSRNDYLNNKKGKDKEGISNLKIYKAQKIQGKWTNITDLEINNAQYSIGHPAISPDGNYLYFASDMPGGEGGSDLYKVKIDKNGNINGTVENLGKNVNSAGDELFPFINKEGTLFFSSDGYIGKGLLDIYAVIINEEGNFVDIINLGDPINSSKDDFSFFMKEDGIHGYIASNRNNNIGNDDIYAFERILPLTLEGVVTDKVNGEKIANSKLEITDVNANESITIYTDEEGFYTTQIAREPVYQMLVSKEKYHNTFKTISGIDTPKTTQTKIVNIELEPIEDMDIIADIDLNTIYFDFDKSYIRDDAMPELNKIIDVMNNTYKDMIVRLESHTDSRGSDVYNEKLSQARAEATYNYLIENGVDPNRITGYYGYGEYKLTNDCGDDQDCNERKHQLNRRTQFVIIKMK